MRADAQAYAERNGWNAPVAKRSGRLSEANPEGAAKGRAERGCDEVPPTRPCKGGQYRLRKPSTPSRKAPECEVGDPEGNLAIVERVVHENQRRFPDWAHGWGGTAHVLTSTHDGTVKQKEQERKLSI